MKNTKYNEIYKYIDDFAKKEGLDITYGYVNKEYFIYHFKIYYKEHSFSLRNSNSLKMLKEQIDKVFTDIQNIGKE